ncbi:hypothetical protein ACFJIX_23520 [Roseateles sp. UC29_93]|uniref:hypothetical protein n=1 Tax=Roseateles sp. UC29_93 TaxID=3350177 RepID=UPI00366C7B83
MAATPVTAAATASRQSGASGTSGAAPEVDLDDIQGLLMRGYGDHPEAVFLLLRVRDAAAARRWLSQVEVSVARRDPGNRHDAPALQLAFTAQGLQALGVRESVIDEFAPEFRVGMDRPENRSDRLGDVGGSAPRTWSWGHCAGMPHALLMLYARRGELAAFRARVDAAWAEGFELLTALPTIDAIDADGREPFGFKDGLSQPLLDWRRERPVDDRTTQTYSKLSCLGEFVLGYPNEYGALSDRPLLNPGRDPGGLLPRDALFGMADLGRNGSYLVMRQLAQDVRSFQRLSDDVERMVGRTHDGVPLTATPVDAEADFTFDDDPEGLHCPIGAHIRRSNPRNADLPGGPACPFTTFTRTIGLDAEARALDLVASTRFHRVLRRGRKYEGGLHFIALNANIGRQFEFVQGAWLTSSHFNGLSAESDPLLGPRVPRVDGQPVDAFSIPRVDGPAEQLTGLPRFVTVRGGAYFFLPGVRALRFLATEPEPPDDALPRHDVGADSGRAGPIERGVHDGFVSLMRVERRIDPFIRPALDALLREPLTRLVQALIVRRLPAALIGALGEERPLPFEAEAVDEIVATMGDYLASHYRGIPCQRAGNTKTHGVVRAELEVRDDVPEALRHGILAEPSRRFPAWVRFGGPGPDSPPDIDDVGVLSIGVKLMGVPGPKLLDDERWTQDLTGISTPVFTTPDVLENARLQALIRRGTPLYFFSSPKNGRWLNGLMQALWSRTQTSPFETSYWSCTAYRLGERGAMQYAFVPRARRVSRVPGLPGRPSDNYLREAMVRALSAGEVLFDVMVQPQTDPRRMPIESAGVRWPASLSPPVHVATLRLPQQVFDSPAQLAFAHRLSINPWHALPAHRPLGSLNRARWRVYQSLSRMRQRMNGTPHVEPTGDETFEC